jgi:hypothetical protein
VTKLTLSVDGAVVERAKRYAARRRTSVSRLVEQYLDLLSRSRSVERPQVPASLARLRAEWRGTSVNAAAYGEYLWRKYR